MRSSRSRHKHGRSQPALRLPSKREVSYFRELRLLRHLHEQLIEQIEENPNDWQLHFQLANLFAFTDDAFYANKSLDIIHAGTHYQTALKLLKTIHEQDYIAYQNSNLTQSCLNTPITSPYDIDINTIDDEEKYSQPKTQIAPQLLYDTQKRNHNCSKSETDFPYKKRRKKRSKNKKHKFEITSPTNKLKQRKLLIAVHANDNSVAKQITCNYTSPMSEEELAMEREKQKGKKKRKRKLKVDITAQYVSAIKTLNAAHTTKKRPSIIMMFSPNSPQNNGGNTFATRSMDALHLNNGKYASNSPISLLQSESETATDSINDEYIIPLEIHKGYTECFFGYGKYLCQNKRIKEGIHNLLECATWYNDSFVDPSCLTSLVLPPQFLFEDSVKKRHCINYRTLTKYISKLLTDWQRYLDKQFKKMNMNKYINEYQKYLDEFQQEMDKHFTIVVNDYELHTPETALMENTISNESMAMDIHSLEYGLSNTSNRSNTSDLRLQTFHSNISIQSNVSTPNILSPATSIVSNISDSNVSNSPGNKNDSPLINYKVYPINVQELVNEYIHLCEYYHRLGLLLADYLRYSDAKREYSKALKIFKKLKIKPALYEDVLSKIRMTQRNSIQSASCQERAQILAQKHKSNTLSRNNTRPVSPSFEFSFSEHSAFLYTSK